MRIGYKEEDKKDYLKEAVDAAKASDVAIVIVWTGRRMGSLRI